MDKRVHTAQNEGTARLSDYGEQTSAAMLDRLSVATGHKTHKIKCFDMDMAELRSSDVDQPVDLLFIDGEHTNQAVLSDFFSAKTHLAADCVIVFHDYHTVFQAVQEIQRKLIAKNGRCFGLKLDGEVYVIFPDRRMIASQRYFMDFHKKWKSVATIERIKCMLPDVVVRLIQRVKRRLR